MDSSSTIANSNSEELVGKWLVSENHKNSFSKDESKLFFGLKPYPILQDTTLLDEEIVKVEVWSYEDERLHTQQKIEKENDLEKSFTTVYHINDQKIVIIGNSEIPETTIGNEGYSNFHLGMNNQPYLKSISWDGFPIKHDVYLINDRSGKSELVAKKINATPRLSPGAKYVYWYDQKDSAWFAFSFNSKITKHLTDKKLFPYYNELHDTPSNPSSYGVASWTQNDDKILINDRYDIWEIDPAGLQKAKRITPNGREEKISYRYRKLNNEERFITSGQKLIFRSFDEKDKSSSIHSIILGKLLLLFL